MSRFVLLALALIGCSDYDLSAAAGDQDLGPDDGDLTVTPAAPTPPVDDPADPSDDEDPSNDDEDPSNPDPADPLPGDTHSDSFAIPLELPVDIVFFGDTSGSMSEELEGLGDQIEQFTDRLVADGVDWHLMAINGDEGCGVDGWFDANSVDWQTRFADALLQEPDEGDEAGLQAAASAVEPAATGGCNAGFLRPDALLHVIFISDEEDQSDGFDDSADYWQLYVDRIVAAKGGVAGAVALSAVAGPAPDGCDGADAGFGYDGAVTGGGGTFLSICEDWATQLDTLAAVAGAQDTFPLASPADPVSIDVFVDGTEIPNSGWTFDVASNAVVFVTAPAPGSTVDISYSSP